MDTVLDALQEGRLIELSDPTKEEALEVLAHLLEAIPSLPAGTDVVELVKTRERGANSGLGRGWAIPHARVPFDGDLLCVVGWSPAGLEYGAPDGGPVSFVAMYLVPDNQRNQFLREASVLAKAVTAYPHPLMPGSPRELTEIREYLLDLISAGKETVGPDARARMIQLQARPTAVALPAHDLAGLVVEPVTIIGGPGLRPLVLGQDRQLVDYLDAAPRLLERLAAEGLFQNGGWRILKRSDVTYQGNRVVYDCLAIRSAHLPSPPTK